MNAKRGYVRLFGRALLFRCADRAGDVGLGYGCGARRHFSHNDEQAGGSHNWHPASIHSFNFPSRRNHSRCVRYSLKRSCSSASSASVPPSIAA